jgi:putative SOS response-associated peptidase YedK
MLCAHRADAWGGDKSIPGYENGRMCGHHVSTSEAFIEREFNLVHQEWQFPSSFNVAPTQQVPILREIAGERRGSLVRWGRVPFFARGNARGC